MAKIISELVRHAPDGLAWASFRYAVERVGLGSGGPAFGVSEDTLLRAQNGVHCNKNQGFVARSLGMSPMQKWK